MAERSNRKVLALVGFFGVVAAAAAFGGMFNPGRSGIRDWYGALEKPPFNPPDVVFGPVWTILYILMAISAYRVWAAGDSAPRTLALRLWFLQLALNAAWSPLFFGAKRPGLALIDILLLLPAIAAYIAVSRKVDRPAAWMMVPYLAWVSFATLLNEEIFRLNR